MREHAKKFNFLVCFQCPPDRILCIFLLLVLLIKTWKNSSELTSSYIYMMVLSTVISWRVSGVIFIIIIFLGIIIIFQKSLLSSYYQNPPVKSQLAMELHFSRLCEDTQWQASLIVIVSWAPPVWKHCPIVMACVASMPRPGFLEAKLPRVL